MLPLQFWMKSVTNPHITADHFTAETDAVIKIFTCNVAQNKSLLYSENTDLFFTAFESKHQKEGTEKS